MWESFKGGMLLGVSEFSVESFVLKTDQTKEKINECHYYLW